MTRDNESRSDDAGGSRRWLRDEVDDAEILPLFADDESVIRRGIRHLLERAAEDPAVERRLIDTLETALEEGSDDRYGALWITVVLGELRSEEATGVLIRSLSSDADEDLQDAAATALLRIGRPAVLALIEDVEEESGPALSRPAYRLLGETGLLDDALLLDHVGQFLEERLGVEERKPAGERAIEELAMSCARLGQRRLLEDLRGVQQRLFHGANPVLQDAIEMLEDNEEGIPFVPVTPPWEERYGWLFDDERDDARVERPRRYGGATAEDHPGSPAEPLPEESDLAYLYWGLSATADCPGATHPLDARRFLDAPASRGVGPASPTPAETVSDEQEDDASPPR